ncbi:type II CRISPR-associated endonuclease Cas1 [Jeotgalibaca caeni]|uniref:type II CRISPR-associated endonuclease Cas1 n=1 Tax=Jeotgalibaca caeni TaxID=3028623 RepID=UPI00237E63C3|nr:type II CRISPR-associated endonuclease Cas1 [Jeotgalibaca caeni]MDE1549161.1 type II CRISPR-associated endonuclease Cas1 [Jeotgalibaca caeni]
MAFRNIYIENPAQLSIRNKQLVINQGEEYTIPVTDIQSVVIDNLQTTLTAPTISFLAENQVALYTCNRQHIPCAVLMPLGNHSRKLQALSVQLETTKRFRNRLWQKIIRQKIENQASCLEMNGLGKVAELKRLSNSVTEGDFTYCESQAALIYFRELFGEGFSRRVENVQNAALNYGYAIIRGVIARDICAHGFEPALGVFHKNELNAFNLADDLIEPYRPYVDLWVSQNISEDERYFLPQHKRELVSLLFTEVSIDNEVHTLTNAVRKTVSSFTSCCRSNSTRSQKLPKLLPLKSHEYE